MTETPARAGEGLSIHLLAGLGEQDVNAMDPGAGSGRLPQEVFVSAGDLCSCCWLFWREKSCDCFRLGFFGFFLKSSALSHCKYQQSCSLYSKE